VSSRDGNQSVGGSGNKGVGGFEKEPTPHYRSYPGRAWARVPGSENARARLLGRPSARAANGEWNGLSVPQRGFRRRHITSETFWALDKKIQSCKQFIVQCRRIQWLMGYMKIEEQSGCPCPRGVAELSSGPPLSASTSSTSTSQSSGGGGRRRRGIRDGRGTVLVFGGHMECSGVGWGRGN